MKDTWEKYVDTWEKYTLSVLRVTYSDIHLY